MFLVSKKVQKKDKNKFVAKSVGIFTITLMQKYLSNCMYSVFGGYWGRGEGVNITSPLWSLEKCFL